MSALAEKESTQDGAPRGKIMSFPAFLSDRGIEITSNTDPDMAAGLVAEYEVYRGQKVVERQADLSSAALSTEARLTLVIAPENSAE